MLKASTPDQQYLVSWCSREETGELKIFLFVVVIVVVIIVIAVVINAVIIIVVIVVVVDP